jgi:2',3'-cyclic-nucleotide 2'-phosphodiesterase (5'-nucleotidase family)
MNGTANRPRWPARRIALILLALTLPAGFWAARCTMPDDKPKTKPPAGEPSVGGIPLFATWPKDAKPELVLVVTGQTYGYLSPCGCSRPQKGGLERRANFLKILRDKGWPVLPVDLGDLAPPKKVQDQDHLKYEYTMKAMAGMGYAAVGLGVQDFDQQLWHLLARYSLQKTNEPPFVLAANLLTKDETGTFTRKAFDVPGGRPMVDSHEIVREDRKANGKPLRHVPVGIVGLLGPGLADRLAQIDKSFAIGKPEDALATAKVALKAANPATAINVLLYGGGKDDAIKLAEANREFHVVVCQSEESEPPQFPTLVNDDRTFVLQVGHKGQNLGLVGVFKSPNGYELKYQLVPLGEEFLTEEGDAAAKANATLRLLEEYTAKVKKDNLLAKFTEKPLTHEAQIDHPDAKLAFVGSDKCQACHPNEFKIWKDSKHGHAMDALEKYAVRPGLRQFDGDCVQCHTVGFRYQTGYKNETETPNLKHVGCESCHGPGSGHIANPNKKEFLANLSKWKTKPDDRLPPKETLEKLGGAKAGEAAPVELEPAAQRVLSAVQTRCMGCHDQENDPKFDLNKYMPKIWHSGFKAPAAGGLPPNAK